MGQIIRTRWHWGAYHAPESWLTELARLTPANCFINSGGEVLPADLPPAVLAGKIAAGMVFLDYCGYPMYYIDIPAKPALKPRPQSIGQAGFTYFLREASIYFPHDFFADKNQFRYPRSLRILREMPQGFIPNTAMPCKTDGYPKIYSNFALKIGKGYYFYAYAHRDGYGPIPKNYAAFVQKVLAGEVRPVPVPPPPKPGPTPPPTPPQPVPPVPPRPSIPFWVIAAGGAVAGYMLRKTIFYAAVLGGAAAIGYTVMQAKRER